MGKVIEAKELLEKISKIDFTTLLIVGIDAKGKLYTAGTTENFLASLGAIEVLKRDTIKQGNWGSQSVEGEQP
jgi:hypothetical protein